MLHKSYSIASSTQFSDRSIAKLQKSVSLETESQITPFPAIIEDIFFLVQT